MQVANIEERVLVTSRQADAFISRMSRRLVTLWALRRLIGKPEECKNCKARTRATYRHCIVLSPTTLLRTRQLVEALRTIVQIYCRCLGWRDLLWVRVIEMEVAAEAKRESERQQMREQMRNARGGNAYWRYYGPGLGWEARQIARRATKDGDAPGERYGKNSHEEASTGLAPEHRLEWRTKLVQ